MVSESSRNGGNELGGLIRVAREKAGLSIRQAAERAGIDYSFWSRIENGQRRKLAAGDVQHMADALNIDASPLLACIGVRPAAVLPSVRTYFRRKLGVDADEADVLAQLIEDYQAKKKGGTNEDTNYRADDETH